LVFQLSETQVVSRSFKFLRGSVRTLTGASLVSLSFVTERLINPFRFKPFLELVLTPLFLIVVDSKTLKQIMQAVTETGIIDKEISVKGPLIIMEAVVETGIIDKEISVKGPPIRVKARVIQDSELPLYFIELEKDLGRI